MEEEQTMDVIEPQEEGEDNLFGDMFGNNDLIPSVDDMAEAIGL